MTKIINKLREVDNATIARTLVLFLGLINAGLKLFGKDVLPISDEQISTAVTAIWTLGGSLWAWWKNNSFTESAIAGDNLKNALKSGVVTKKDLEDIDDEDIEVVGE